MYTSNGADSTKDVIKNCSGIKTPKTTKKWARLGNFMHAKVRKIEIAIFSKQYWDLKTFVRNQNTIGEIYYR